MIKKTIYISKPCSVSLRYNQMVVSDKDSGDVRTVPVEDIGLVLVENQQALFTVPVLTALSENNSTVVFCDKRMRPCSIMLPMEGNAIQAEVQKRQMDAGEPLKKQLWKQVIVSKIKNQASVLDSMGRDGSLLKPYYANVKSGDSDNREGAAARIYWSLLFDESFCRDQNGEDGINAMLNYGYAILRSAMCRAVIGSGLSLSYGLFHKSRYNSFPLADDLMEPYRQYVDSTVLELSSSGVNDLNRDAKIRLLNVLTCDVRMGEFVRPLEIALSFTTASLVKCLSGESKLLSLPVV